jgi:hypothetical protein
LRRQVGPEFNQLIKSYPSLLFCFIKSSSAVLKIRPINAAPQEKSVSGNTLQSTPLHHAAGRIRPTRPACCGADGTWLAIGHPRTAGAQRMPGNPEDIDINHRVEE